MTKDQLIEKIMDRVGDYTIRKWLSTELDAYSSASNNGKPIVSSSGNVCPDCGDFGIIQDEVGNNNTCPCHYR